jgi:Tol biopolymer transport system component
MDPAMRTARSGIVITLGLLAALVAAPAGAAVRVSIGDATITEGDARTRKVTLPVTLSAAYGDYVVVNWTVIPGTADGSDVVVDSSSVTIAPGDIAASIKLTIKADTIGESTESFTVVIVPPPGIDPGRTTGTVTILDDDPQTHLATPPGSASGAMALSANGRYVAFASASTGIVIGDTYTGTKIFRRDLQTAETILVTHFTSNTGGAASSPSISADGRYVAYATSFHAFGVTDNNNTEDVEVRDLVAQTTKVVSVTPAGATGNGYSTQPSISDDGQRVAFLSTASDLAGNDADGIPDVYVRDLVAGTTTLMTGSTSTGAAVGGVEPAISGDGSAVAFSSNSSQLTGPPTSGYEVYVRQVARLAIVRASLGPGGVAANGQSQGPSLDRDGSHVAFLSTATNLGAAGGIYEGFVRDLAAGTTTRVTASKNGGSPDAGASAVAINGDGNFVAFVSSAANIAPPTAAPGSHAFVRNVADASTTQVDLDSNDAAPNGSVQSALAVDEGGGRIAFISSATDLMPSPTTGQLVFARDWPVNGVAVGDVSVVEPGEQTAKLSFAVTSRKAAAADIPVDYQIVAGTASAPQDLVVKSGTVTIAAGQVAASVSVTVKGDTLLESDESFTVRIVPHGRAATRAVGNGSILDGTQGQFGSFSLIYGNDLSGDGKLMTYVQDDGIEPVRHYKLMQRNLATGVQRQILPKQFLYGGTLASNYDGRWIVVDSPAGLDPHYPGNPGYSNVFLVDAIAKTARRIDPGPATVYSDFGGISADGRYVSVSTNVDLVAGDGTLTPFPRSYVLDRTTWTSELVSMAVNGTAFDKAQAGPISADGRYVTFMGGFTGSGGAHCADTVAMPAWRRDRIESKTTLVTPYDTASDTIACDERIAGITADGAQVLIDYWTGKEDFFDVPGDGYLYVRDGATGVATAQLPHPPNNSCQVESGGRFDAAGRRFVASSDHHCENNYEIVTGDVDGDTYSLVETRSGVGNFNLSLSDDGRIALSCQTSDGECHALALPR